MVNDESAFYLCGGGCGEEAEKSSFGTEDTWRMMEELD